MKRLRNFASSVVLFLAFGSVAGVIVGGAVVFIVYHPNNEGLRISEQMEILRNLETRFREQPNSSGAIIITESANDRFTALGLPRKDSSEGYAWIIANPSHGLRAIVPERARFSVSRAEVEMLKKRTKIHDDIVALLLQATE